MSALRWQYETVWSTVLLAIHSVAGNVFNNRVGAGHMQKTAMRAVLHHVLINAAADALLNNHDLRTPSVTFVSSYVGKESFCVKEGEGILGLRWRFVSFLYLLQPQSLRTMTTFRLRTEKKDVLCRAGTHRSWVRVRPLDRFMMVCGA